MQLKTIFRILGILLMVFSISMLPPAVIALWYGDGAWDVFLIAFGVTFLTGAICWLYCRKAKTELKARDGFFIVVLFWTVLSIFGAIPLMLAAYPHLSLSSAVFESVSGLTTTGATVLSGIDHLPHGILYYRQQLQFLGGMGIVVLAVAILPVLGIGGMQLYRAENTSLAKDTKLTPRVTQTAKALWYIYLGLVVVCAFAYWAGGMNLFDAVCQSFSTVSTGGFSTHDASFGYFNSHIINTIAIIFMILGGTNFSLHYYAMQKVDLSFYRQDVEFRTMIFIFISMSVLVTGVIYFHHVFPHLLHSFDQSLFQVVSIGTSTGFSTTDFQDWPGLVPILLLFIGVIGACAASTSGGLKVVRLMLLVKQGSKEIKRLIHPSGVIPIKLGGLVIDDELLQAVWGFIAALLGLYVLIILLLMGCGLDFQSAFANAVCALGNVGVSVGYNAMSFANLNDIGKWIMVFGMIAGRLEVFTLLVLFSPSFWRK